VTTSSLRRARLVTCYHENGKLRSVRFFCVQKENIAVILSKFASNPSKQKSYASWFCSYAWPINEEV